MRFADSLLIVGLTPFPLFHPSIAGGLVYLRFESVICYKI